MAPVEEPEASQAIAKVFSDDGISVHTSVTITALRREGIGIAATVAAGAGVFEVRATGPLAATGRRPVTAGLGLDEASSSPWTTTSSICTRRGGLRLNLGGDDALLCCPLEGRGVSMATSWVAWSAYLSWQQASACEATTIPLGD